MWNRSSKHSKSTRVWRIPFYLVMVSILFLLLVPISEAEEPEPERLDIYLFGSGLDGNLGIGNEDNQLDPLRFQSSVFDEADITAADIKEISAGQIQTRADGTTDGVGAHTLIVTNDGDVYSFGNNKYGQLGLGQGDFTNLDIPTKIEGLPGGDPAISAVAKGRTSFILTESGSVYSFGGDYFGSLGLGDLRAENDEYFEEYEEYKYEEINRYLIVNEPQKIELDPEEYDVQLPPFKEISVGGLHGLFISEGGDVYSFGSGAFGKLGHGDDDRKYVPTKIDSLSNINSVSAGYNHSLVLTEDGDVYSFGYNSFIGQGEYDDYNAIESEPKQITGIQKIEKISAGLTHSLLLDVNNNVHSFGGESYYTLHGNNSRLGLGEDIDRQLQPRIINELNGVTISDISAGARHSLLVSDTGEIYSFGLGHSGQLGHGDEEDQWEPKKIDSLNQVQHIAAGTNYSFVVGSPVVELEDLTFNGQTVAGFESDNFNYNVTLPYGTEITPVVDGTAKKDDSTIEITQATGVDGVATIVVTGEDGVTSNTYEINFSVSEIEPSDAYFFGGEIGADVDNYLSPIKVDNLSEVIAVSAGDEHVLALTKDGGVNSIADDYESGDEPEEINIGGDKAVSVSAGFRYSLILTETGDVYSHGEGNYGKLGHGDTKSVNFNAKKIEDIPRVSAVSAGWRHSLILTEDGDVYSFGSGGDGRLGHGDEEDQLSPKKIADVSDIQAISAGREHSLLLDESGNVYSFGSGSDGNLGHGDRDDQLTPKQITSIDNVEAISAGGQHSLVLTESGDVHSFGRNSEDQLGYNSGRQETPKKIETLSDINIISISAGYRHNLVVSDTDDVYSFGEGNNGQLGLGDTEPRVLPTKIKGMSEGILAEAGRSISIVTSAQTPDMTLLADLSIDGETIYGFEKNKMAYQITLPFGTTEVPTIEAEADFLSNDDVTITAPDSLPGTATIEVSDGIGTSTYTIEIIVAKRQFDKVGEAFSFGGGANGQLGLGNNEDQVYPRYLSTVGNVVGISAGNGYTLLFNDLGEVYSFGNSERGRLGHNPAISYNEPQKIEFISDVVAVSAGGSHSLILTKDGDGNRELYSFGNGSNGRLGHVDDYDRLEPKKVEGLPSNISTISAGSDGHNLILTDDGDVYGFGSDRSRRLGGEDETATPVIIANLSELNVEDISAGDNHNLVLTETGEVYSFGNSSNGRLGLGDDIVSNQAEPGKIGEFNNVIDISAGRDHSLLLTADGEIYSFGRGNEGQLGHGDNDDQWEPKKIESLAGETIIAVKAGYRHSLVLTEDGEVYAFGEGGEGRLGLGNSESYSTPQRITCLSGINTIAAGHSHSIVLGSPGISSSLCGMLVDGTPFEGFDRETVSYDVELETGTTEVPTVTGIPVDGRAGVEVNEATSLPGTTTITVTSTDGTEKTFSINFLVDLTYTTNVTGQPTFNDVREGYSPIPIKFVSIERTGTGDITNLSVEVSGEDADAFQVGDLGGVDPRIDEELQPIMTGEELGITILNDDFSSTNFALGPKDDLDPGDYSATVTITADEGVEESFDINFHVEALPSEPESQATNLTFSSTPSNDIVLSFDATDAADGYVVVRKDDEGTIFVPEFGITYSAGAEEEGIKIIGSSSETSYEDSGATQDTDYYYAVYAYNGSGDERVYLTTDPLKGQSKLHGGAKASNITVQESIHSTSTGFPDAGVNITFPDGMQQETTFDVEKVTSEPSNFMVQPNVRRVSPLYFNITAEPNDPGNYTLVLDFSDLGLNQSQWENFNVFKRDEVTSQWQDVVTDLGAVIVNRQTDGKWGKFTISGLDSFSQFTGGEDYEAETHQVITSSNDGNGSLRQLIEEAEAGDVILFDELPSDQVDITDPLIIDKDLTIRGNEGTIIDGSGETRIFNISPNVSVKIENLQIQNGNDNENVVGGILNEGTLTLVNSVVLENEATGVNNNIGGVGGILQESPEAKLVIINSTIAGNSGAESNGGTGGVGVYEMDTGEQGPVEIYNSIIYGNDGDHADAFFEKELNVSYHSLYGFAEETFSITEASENLFETDPQFVGAETNAEHPYLISENSPAVDAGNNAFIQQTSDVRGLGFRRVSEGVEDGASVVDIGAYEYQLYPVYFVTYDGNGNSEGNVPNDDTWYESGDEAVVLGNDGDLVKPDHVFDGWNTEADGSGETYSQADTFIVDDANLNLYASWKDITGIDMSVTPSKVYTNENFEETFELVVNVDTVTDVQESDISLGDTFENLLIDSVTFTDTTITISVSGELTDDGTGSITVDAEKLNYSVEDLTVNVTVNNPPTYTVTFNSDGGSAVESISGEWQTTISEPDTPTRNGYNFDGWYTESELDNHWDFSSDVLTEDITLYAGWTETHTVTFESDGGSVVSSIIGETQTTISEPDTPTKTGYNFHGWYTESELDNHWDFSSDVLTEDITLYAGWTKLYTVTYESNGGSSVESETVENSSTITQPEAPTRSSRTFRGWYTESTWDNQWDFESDVLTEDITLYARWRVISSGGQDESSVEEVPVRTETESGETITEANINRTTDSEGRISDEVRFTPDSITETIQRVRDAGQSIVRMVIPDDNDEVSEVEVNVDRAALEEMANTGIDLTIASRHAQISIPNQSSLDFDDDLYFRVIPIRDEEERESARERARSEESIRDIAPDTVDDIEIIGRPNTIETNMQNRQVNVMLPIPEDVDETASFLNDVIVFVEHSDGTNEVVRGQLADFEGDQLGYTFNVDRFSNFTMVYMEGVADFFGVQDSYINGFEDGTFRPNESITRAEMAAMLSRNLGEPEGSLDFIDVDPDHWSANYVAHVNLHGLMEGFDETTFGPMESVTRAQMATIASRWVTTMCESSDSLFDLCESSDETNEYAGLDMDHWAYEAIMNVRSLGIMNGYVDNTFRPERALTRAEVVTVLNSLFQRSEFEVDDTPSFTDVVPDHWAFEDIERAARDN